MEYIYEETLEIAMMAQVTTYLKQQDQVFVAERGWIKQI